jgi:hypothetical protein
VIPTFDGDALTRRSGSARPVEVWHNLDFAGYLVSELGRVEGLGWPVGFMVIAQTPHHHLAPGIEKSPSNGGTDAAGPSSDDGAPPVELPRQVGDCRRYVSWAAR